MRHIYLVTGLTPDEQHRCWSEARTALGEEQEPWFQGIVKAGGSWRFLTASTSGKRAGVICYPVTVRSNTKAARELMRVDPRRSMPSLAYCSCGGDLLAGEHRLGCIRIPQKLRVAITCRCAPFFETAARQLALGTTTLERVRAERARVLAARR